MTEKEKGCGSCSFCLGSPYSITKTCELARKKISVQRTKMKKYNFERKYTLDEVLAQRDVAL